MSSARAESGYLRHTDLVNREEGEKCGVSGINKMTRARHKRAKHSSGGESNPPYWLIFGLLATATHAYFVRRVDLSLND